MTPFLRFALSWKFLCLISKVNRWPKLNFCGVVINRTFKIGCDHFMRPIKLTNHIKEPIKIEFWSHFQSKQSKWFVRESNFESRKCWMGQNWLFWHKRKWLHLSTATKCWWNWLQVSISPIITQAAFCTKVFYEALFVLRVWVYNILAMGNWSKSCY